MRKPLQTLLLVGIVLALVFQLPGAAQEDVIRDAQENIERLQQDVIDVQQRQQQVRQQIVDNARKIDVATAQADELKVAVDELNNEIAGQETLLAAAQLALQQAEESRTAALERSEELEGRIRRITAQMSDQSVQLYLERIGDSSFLLVDGDLNRNATRSYYASLLGADALRIIDNLRQLQDEQQLALQQAEASQTAADRAAEEIRQESEALAELLAAQAPLIEALEELIAEYQLEAQIFEEADAELQRELRTAQENISEQERIIAAEEERRRQEAARLERERLARQQTAADAARDEALLDRAGECVANEPPQMVRPVNYPIASGYGLRIHPIFGTRRFHHGVDLGGRQGEPIVAAAPGEVIRNEWQDGYGYIVIIDHGGCWTTLYAHLAERSPLGIGSSIARNDPSKPVGLLGCTGWCTGAHLHFEVRFNGASRDPAVYLQG